ncbi:MAG: biotin--[Lachnospiraceae bacterium]|nr:biotin--[acetyl-CoA-carboxylase] ligase [Lachnospiraceae bacterium]
MKAEILAMLREKKGYVSGQEMSERLGVSRTAVWKVIHQLNREGYEIKAVQNRGYRLTEAPDVMSESELQSLRKTKWVGERICYFDEIDSTNSRASQLAEEGALHGTLVVADHQNSGRGRRGRSWSSPSQTGIFMTLLLRPDIEPANASMLTLLAALAVARGIEKNTGLTVQIKWPNDIVINGKKVCGILTEMNAQMDYVNHIIIGIGINVHNTEFPDEIVQTATSIYLESGRHVQRAELIEAIWEEFEACYEGFLETQDLSSVLKEYDQYLVNRGKRVCVLDPKGTFEGVAEGITERGELLVETAEGQRKVASGEVSVRGVYGYV